MMLNENFLRNELIYQAGTFDACLLYSCDNIVGCSSEFL